jgi:amino acid adenylation domain-containing protein
MSAAEAMSADASRPQSQETRFEEQLAFWRSKLLGISPIELPSSRLRPTVGAALGAVRARLVGQLPRDLVERLEAASRSLDATLFTTMLAVFSTLLSRHSSQVDLAIGVWGTNSNLLVARCDLGGHPTARELVARTRAVVDDAFANQDVPFARLVEALHPERDSSQAPLVQVTFALHDAADLPPESDTAKADFLSLRVSRGADGSALVAWEYETALFDRPQVERMAAHYGMLLEGFARGLDVSIARMPMLTAEEETTLLRTWNDTKASFRQGMCLHHLFEEQVDRTPDAVALVFEGDELTYRELDERANRLAHYLRRKGIGIDDLVGICAERSFELIVGILGILKAGAAYAPLDPEYPRDRLGFMIEDSGVSILLTQKRLRGLLSDVAGHNARLVMLDDAWSPIAREEASRPGVTPPPQALAYVVYTSGSTGRPKAAMNTHAAICNRLSWQQETFRLTSADRVLHKASIGFDLSVWECIWPLLAGAQLVLARPQAQYDLAYQIELIRSRGITLFHLMPSVIPIFVDLPGFDRCTTIRQVITGGEAVSFETQQRFFSRSAAAFANCYGPSECAVDVTAWMCERGDHRGVVPIGWPLANIQIHILDNAGMLVPAGVAGELCIGGLAVGRGYHRRPDLTAEKFVPDPFSTTPGGRLYRTGDLARRMPDGNIEFLGRIDHQVKLRGYRIELGEIEASLSEHSGVSAAVVAVRDDGDGNKKLVAYVVARSPETAEEPLASELQRKLGGFLPDYMVPSTFVFLRTLPLTPSGKVDRRALPAPQRSRSNAS